MIEVSDLIKGNIEIRMNEREIKELNKNEIILINTGNLIIKSTEVYFELTDKNAALINVEKTHSNFNISLDDFDIDFDSTNGKISINYLNPGDEINFTLLTDMQTNIKLKHRQEEVSTEIKTDYNPETPGVILDAFYNAINSNLAMSLVFALGAPDFRKFKKRKKENPEN